MNDKDKKNLNRRLQVALKLSESAYAALGEIAEELKGKDSLEKVTNSIARSNKHITEILGELKSNKKMVALQNVRAMSIKELDVQRLVDYLEGEACEEIETISESTRVTS